MAALVILGVLAGFVSGWLAHRRLSLHYKERWLQAIGMLNSRALDVSGNPDVPPLVAPTVATYGEIAQMHAPPRPKPYIAGKWALDERHEDSVAVFYAIRAGFDDVRLGSANNFQRYVGLYRMTKENAAQAVADMNKR